MLTPDEAVKLSPMVDPACINGALYSPDDGYIDPSTYCYALIQLATKQGTKVQNKVSTLS